MGVVDHFGHNVLRLSLGALEGESFRGSWGQRRSYIKVRTDLHLRGYEQTKVDFFSRVQPKVPGRGISFVDKFNYVGHVLHIFKDQNIKIWFIDLLWP